LVIAEGYDELIGNHLLKTMVFTYPEYERSNIKNTSLLKTTGQQFEAADDRRSLWRIGCFWRGDWRQSSPEDTLETILIRKSFAPRILVLFSIIGGGIRLCFASGSTYKTNE